LKHSDYNLHYFGNDIHTDNNVYNNVSSNGSITPTYNSVRKFLMDHRLLYILMPTV